MEIRIETGSYNERRYGKPWIARVNFNKNTQGDFSWGDFLGGAGDEGMLIIAVNPGDIVAQGQKDNRGGNTAVTYSRVTADGRLDALRNKSDAYKYFTETMAVAPDLDALREERVILIARIAEIDAILAQKGK